MFAFLTSLCFSCNCVHCRVFKSVTHFFSIILSDINCIYRALHFYFYTLVLFLTKIWSWILFNFWMQRFCLSSLNLSEIWILPESLMIGVIEFFSKWIYFNSSWDACWILIGLCIMNFISDFFGPNPDIKETLSPNLSSPHNAFFSLPSLPLSSHLDFLLFVRSLFGRITCRIHQMEGNHVYLLLCTWLICMTGIQRWN